MEHQMKPLTTTTIGFIGLGLMGKPMARNLKNAGANVAVFNRSQHSVGELVNEGFVATDSPACAAHSNFVICMVSDTAAVENVLFGPSGVIETQNPDCTVIDMGTTEVNATRDFAKRLNAAGIRFVDAPVSGGEIGAINAQLSIMVGASDRDMQRTQGIFDVLGQQVVHVGSIGAGQIAKAANQIIVGLTIGAVAEAFALARDGDADLERVWQALSGGFADSRILQIHGRRMIDGSFSPGGKAATQLKDLVQALRFADTNHTRLPATSLCRDLYQQLIEHGEGELDHSALFRLYQRK